MREPETNTQGAPSHPVTGYGMVCPFLLFLMVLLFSACGERAGDGVLILGQIEGTTGIFYLQEQNTFELQKIDSVTPAGDGSFRLFVRTTEASIYALKNAAGDQAVFIAAPGDTIRIFARFDRYPSEFKVSGNRESELLQTFYDYSNLNLKKVDSLQLLIDRNQGEKNFFELTVRADSLFSRIWEAQRQYEKSFIQEHPGAFASLLVVNFHFGVKPVLSPLTDMSDYHRVDSGLQAIYPANKHTLFFHRWLKEIRSSARE